MAAGCSTENESINNGPFTFRLSEGAPERSVRLSELMDVERIVPLETSAETLVPQYFDILVTENEIVLIDADKIQCFGLDGKYQRTLAQKGGGPDEFNMVRQFARNGDSLYYIHMGDPGHIHSVSIKTAGHGTPVPLPIDELNDGKPVYLAGMTFLNDSTIVCVSAGTGPAYSLFYVSRNGQLNGGIPSIQVDQENLTTIRPTSGTPSIRQVGKEIHYIRSDFDTLFALHPDHMDPVAMFDNSEMASDDPMEGFGHNISSSGESFVLVNTSYRKIEQQTSNGVIQSISVRVGNLNNPESGLKAFLFMAEKSDGTLSRVSDAHIDDLGFTVSAGVLNGLKGTGGFGVLPITAIDFKEKAAEVLADESVSEEVRERVGEVDRMLTEDSNPVLLIGRLK